MANSKKYKLSGINIAALGFIITAISMLAIQLIHLVTYKNIIEFAAIGINVIGAVLVILGFLKVMSFGNQFKKGFLGGIAAVAFLALEVLMALRDIKAGMDSLGTFIDFTVVFCAFMATTAILYGYTKAFRGLKDIAEKFSTKLAKSYKWKWVIACAGVYGALFLVPVMGLFPAGVHFVGTIIFAFAGFGVQVWLSLVIMQGAKKLNNKPTAGQQEQQGYTEKDAIPAKKRRASK